MPCLPYLNSALSRVYSSWRRRACTTPVMPRPMTTVEPMRNMTTKKDTPLALCLLWGSPLLYSRK